MALVNRSRDPALGGAHPPVKNNGVVKVKQRELHGM
jgi:hypothetical protein